jgi:hypothetical protein
MKSTNRDILQYCNKLQQCPQSDNNLLTLLHVSATLYAALWENERFEACGTKLLTAMDKVSGEWRKVLNE